MGRNVGSGWREVNEYIGKDGISGDGSTKSRRERAEGRGGAGGRGNETMRNSGKVKALVRQVGGGGERREGRGKAGMALAEEQEFE